MAQYKSVLPKKVMQEFKKIQGSTEQIFGAMTRAGAEVAQKKIKASAPSDISGYTKISKTYRTPSDGGINTAVYLSGYLPFSDPNRKYFTRKAKGRVYSTTKGVPVDFLAKLYEYGRSTAPFPKKPFLRSAFSPNDIEKAMLKAQKEASGGLLDDDIPF